MSNDGIIVVLGKGIFPDGSLKSEAKLSVEMAVYLFKNKEAGMMMMTGRWSFSTRSDPAKTEAQAMKEYAVQLGVPASAILIEDRSLDATGNAYYVGKMLDNDLQIKKMTVVTVDYHMTRVAYVFRKAFDDTLILRFATANSGLSGDSLRIKERAEAKSLALMHKLFDQEKGSGFGWFSKIVEKTNPLYATNFNTVPQIVWDAFGEAGFAKEDLIKKYGKRRSKSF
ncbi:MAG: YdcF family protein [Candidatus Micrarchaeaceae archaeon]